MTQQPIEASTSWGGRSDAIRRAAMSVLAAVSFATVVPAIANAAGADVPNPVFFALRSAGSALSSDPCETPEATPEATAEATPTDAPSAAPSAAPADCEEKDDDGDGTTAAPSASAAPEAVPSAEPSKAETEAEDGEHGKVVSTVAKCAPHGKDPLFETAGEELRNHGAFVKAAAHGDTLTTPWGTFDLSTQAGADALCAAIDLARADLAADAEKADKGKAKSKDGKARGGKDKAKGGKGKKTAPAGAED